jgi:hypothetical protein
LIHFINGEDPPFAVTLDNDHALLPLPFLSFCGGRCRLFRSVFDPQNLGKVNTKLQLTAYVHQARKQTGSMGHSMEGPWVRHFQQHLHAEGQPFLADPEDKHALQVGRGLFDGINKAIGPFIQIAFGRGSIEEPPAGPREHGAIVAMAHLQEFGARPISPNADLVPTIGLPVDRDKRQDHV